MADKTWIQKLLDNIADLITRTKGLNDIHDDVGTHETSQATHRTALTNHESAQSTHRTALGTHNTALTNHEASQATHRAALTTHNTALTNHEASQATHRAALTNHESAQATSRGKVETIETDTDPKVMGRSQIKATTEDLQQAAGAKDLVTGTDQDVIIESLTLRCPVDCSDDAGAFTGISIQTDDATPQVIISQADGVKANLTEDAQLAWTGAILLKATQKIQLTIYGDPADAATVCDIVIKCRAVVSGGYLA